MKSLRMRSGSGGTEDLLQLRQAATAALVHVVEADAEPLGDRGGVELLQMGELEDGAVVVVAHLGDAPAREALGLPAAGLVLQRLVGVGAALRLVAGEGGVVRARLPVGLVALVEAAAGPALVAQLLAAVVEARVV